ncbi:MAG: glycosyltransferase [Actinomycetales bacterium]|nr:glycosyltransferase [Actinomycetales bacterium]
MTKLSVTGVIATRDQATFIREAVLSLLTEVDELIVVDDGSHDATWQVLLECSAPHLRLIRHDVSKGVSHSFNEAVALASSDVILIQGGDDRSLPGRALSQATVLLDPEVVLVYSRPIVINGAGRVLPPESAGEFLGPAENSDPLHYFFYQGNFICAPSVAVRRQDYLTFGGFPPGIDLLQDFGLWLAMVARGKFVRLDRPVVEYRKHGTNLSRESMGRGSSRQRRYAAEMDAVLSRFVATADRATLERLARGVGHGLPSWAPLDDSDCRTLLLLNHPLKQLVRRGLANLFDMLAREDGDEAFAHLGLDIEDLNRFAVLADHENRDEVTRAARVSTRLTQLQSQSER